MATEYKLSYTASEINRKLATVDETANALENNYYTSANIDTKLEEVNASIEDVGGLLETKADLDENGKIPTSQLPDNMVDLSNYYTKSETDDMIGDCNAVINSINTLIGGEST